MMKIGRVVAVAAVVLGSLGKANADPITATFRGVDTGTIFSLSFEDSSTSITSFEGNVFSKDIHWSWNDKLGAYRGDESAFVTAGTGPKYDHFTALSSVTLFGGMFVDMVYLGTNVHVELSGLANRT
ncbi:MAG: hypothetical protein EOO38_29210, partial [Cytophagaceae bacterium]